MGGVLLCWVFSAECSVLNVRWGSAPPFLFPIYTEPLRQEGLFLYRSAALCLVSFCYPLALGFLGLSLLARALGAFRPCFGAPARGIRRFLRFLEVFWRFFTTHKTHWLGTLVSGRVFETLSRPYLCPSSPYFGLQGRLGICIVVWVAAARRKKRRTSSVFLLVRSGLTGFQLYSVLVSCLEDSWSSEWWCWRSLGKKLCGVNHGKRICMTHKTLV